MSRQCRKVAVRAYHEMKRCGRRDDHAYEVAVHLVRHFHPEIRRLEAFEIVAEWLDELEASRPGY